MLLKYDTIDNYVAEKKGQFYFKTDTGYSDETMLGLKKRRQELRQIFIPSVMSLCQSYFKRAIKKVVSLSNGGTFHLLYAVTDYIGHEYVVRINIPELGLKAYEFFVDGWIYEILKKSGLPSLNVFAIDLSQDHVPFDYSIIEHASGTQLSLLQDPETQYLAPEIFESLGRFIAKLHTISLSKFGPLDIRSLNESSVVGVHDQWQDYLMCRFKEHISMCVAIGAITDNQGEKIELLFHKLLPVLNQSPSALLHGDLGNHNLFSDGKKITAVIDWEDCMSGDPVFDIAYWGTFFRDHFRDQLLAGYKQLNLLPDDFELRYWLYYLRVSMSKTVHRYRFGYVDVQGRPPASMRIIKALEHIEKLI